MNLSDNARRKRTSLKSKVIK